MEKTTGTRTGRKPKNDPADRKYSFRLNAEENTRFERLLADSGAQGPHAVHQESNLFGTDKGSENRQETMDYYIKLTEFHKQFQAIGNNYQPGGACLEEQISGRNGRERCSISWKD